MCRNACIALAEIRAASELATSVPARLAKARILVKVRRAAISALTSAELDVRMTPAALVLGAVIVVAFVALGQYAPQAHPELFDRFAIVPARFDPDYAGRYPSLTDAMAALFGHVFFHYGPFHLLMNGLAYLQVAPFLSSRLGDTRFLLLFFLSALGGALAFILINANAETGAVGASGAICGLFGAYFLAVRPTPRAALADPQVRNAMLMFLGINVVLMAFLPLPIAWEAHLGGFLVGAAAYVALARRQRRAGPWG
jgi:membrane associated rhomboid family serine protease